MDKDDDRDIIAQILEGESVSASLEIIHGKSPKVVVKTKIVVDFDKFDTVPEKIVTLTKRIYDEAEKQGINLYPIQPGPRRR